MSKLWTFCLCSWFILILHEIRHGGIKAKKFCDLFKGFGVVTPKGKNCRSWTHKYIEKSEHRSEFKCEWTVISGAVDMQASETETLKRTNITWPKRADMIETSHNQQKQIPFFEHTNVHGALCVYLSLSRRKRWWDGGVKHSPSA